MDYSEEMLKVFRSKLDSSMKARIICQDVCKLDLKEQFDLVIIPFNSIAEITDIEKRKQAIYAVYRHLSPEGTFFCTLYNPAYRVKTADGNMRALGKFGLGNGKPLFVTYYNNNYEKEKIISGTQFYEIYDDKNHPLEKRFLDICFSVIEREEMLAIASEAGFSTKEIYGDYQSNPYAEDSMFMNSVFEKQA